MPVTSDASHGTGSWEKDRWPLVYSRVPNGDSLSLSVQSTLRSFSDEIKWLAGCWWVCGEMKLGRQVTQFLFSFTAKGNLFFVFPRLGGTCRLGATKGHPSTSIRASGSPKKGAACRSLSKYFKWKRVDSLASITFRSKCFPLGKSATRRRRPIWSESLRTRRRWELQFGCNHSRRQLDTRLTWNYRKRGDR